jgi:hypothetical protein
LLESYADQMDCRSPHWNDAETICITVSQADLEVVQ